MYYLLYIYSHVHLYMCIIHTCMCIIHHNYDNLLAESEWTRGWLWLLINGKGKMQVEGNMHLYSSMVVAYCLLVHISQKYVTSNLSLWQFYFYLYSDTSNPNWINIIIFISIMKLFYNSSKLPVYNNLILRI